MSSRALTSHVIVCDGCGVEYGEAARHETSEGARRAALADGWKIVPKLTGRGRPCHIGENLGRIGNRAKDACPTCAPNLQPERWAGNGGQNGGAWFTERIRQLEEENAKLRRAGA